MSMEYWKGVINFIPDESTVSDPLNLDSIRSSRYIYPHKNWAYAGLLNVRQQPPPNNPTMPI